jgi:hypothetical protein
MIFRCVEDFEAEVCRIARDVPVGGPVVALAAEPLLQLVGSFVLQPTFTAQKRLAARIGKPKEEMFELTKLRRRARIRRIGVLPLAGRVRRTAALAVVAVLVMGTAFRTLTLGEAIRQEHLLHRVVILFDGARLDQTGSLQASVDFVGPGSRFVGMGGLSRKNERKIVPATR